jgi:D-glycero-alpha-D-manno-heptose-7-phosphate kinase
MIVSRTPFRISFFGGGTDYPAWYRRHGGRVLATTIDKYCYLTCRHLPPFFEHKYRVVYSNIDICRTIEEIRHPAARAVIRHLNIHRGLEIHHDGDLPARSGMGSSSAFTVGLLNALRALEGRHITKEALANDAIHVEQEVLRESVGAQDQISVAFGGFNHISFRPDGAYQVAPMILPRERLDSLQEQLMLVFTGISRTAAEVADTVIGNMRAQAAALRAMQEMVAEGVEILSSPSADLTEFGRLLSRSWRLKRELSPSVSNAIVDDLFETATRAGAIGGKLLGAGGGGFVLLFVRKEDRARLLEALPRFTVVPFRFESSGCQIALYQPNGL